MACSGDDTAAPEPATPHESATRAWSEARSLMFVCLGNVCRSPFAEGLALRDLPAGRTASSAGHYPGAGRRSPPEAVAVARGFGVDLRPHRSRVLSEGLLAEADAIFVCDEQNYAAVTTMAPGATGRTHYLGALDPRGPLTVGDPFGGGLGGYQAVYAQIAAAIVAARRASTESGG